MENALHLNAVRLAEDKKHIVLLDQTLLPNEVKYLTICKAEDLREAIRSLRVRGAPAIGVAGGYGYYLLADRIETGDMDAFVAACAEHMAYLNSARPTAVNLSWALNRMHSVLLAEKEGRSVAEMKRRLLAEAEAIREEDIGISRSIGEHGFALLEELGRGVGVMTHCNAGTLAAAGYGTALAPVYIALERGWDGKRDIHVYCDETRPLLQGARLTAYELRAAGVDTYVQCDSMAAYTMRSGKIGVVFVGCDRVAANGDFANKIGTSGVAIIAKHYGVPVYCCAPSSSIDMTLKSGDEIPIEQRGGEEVTEMWYARRMAPEDIGVVNPAFDVTDHSLVTGIITEKGIARAPFRESFEKMGIRPVKKYVGRSQ